ncbi:MAG: hypothetical protein KAW56_12060 [Candidatus Marinimicrobia bacterium]|nr:hypothetical protein [Candidatus Neomarinimicrobiota bacterium]MCK4447799.1 hypothetical protein [Candidatus Neomarinimicrobiota bacterium]
MSIFYYKTGQLKSEIPYKNGFLNGTEKIYFKLGTLLSETLYRKNVKEEPTKFFSPDGKLQ